MAEWSSLRGSSKARLPNPKRRNGTRAAFSFYDGARKAENEEKGERGSGQECLSKAVERTVVVVIIEFSLLLCLFPFAWPKPRPQRNSPLIYFILLLCLLDPLATFCRCYDDDGLFHFPKGIRTNPIRSKKPLDIWTISNT